jgi:glycosyltransferase involved in cell wall biosynthesis
VRIVIVADDKQKEGGNNEIINHLRKALSDYATMEVSQSPSPSPATLRERNQSKSIHVDVKYIDIEEYLPRYLPKNLKELFRPIYLRNISRDTTTFMTADLIITTQPNSHCIRHEKHIIYFQHHLKQYYDLFWYSFRQKKGIRRKTIFLILAALVRTSDRFYLTTNLRNSHVVVNSKTVGDRLKKYNKYSNFDVIHPGCDNPLELNGRVYSRQPDPIGNTKDFRAPLLLSFSRLNVTQKGIDIIMQTALNLPQYHFIIAGPYDPSIDAIKSSLGITPKNVKIMMGNFSKEQKAHLYSSCNLFLAPYIEEDFGITPLEANAYGKPVIYCMDSGEIVRTQKHKQTGFMCTRTPSSIAEGIEYCLNNKESMAQACIENAKQYSWDNFEQLIVQYIIGKTMMTK